MRLALFLVLSVLLGAPAQKEPIQKVYPDSKVDRDHEKQLAAFDSMRVAHALEDVYHHIPTYHFSAPEKQLNDPNGLCFWNGKWHMFYQAYPAVDSRQHWGHAVSDDCVHWKDMPYAIYPGPEKYCYSGATFVDGDRVIATWYGRPIGEMIGTSSDPMLTEFEKIGNKPVIEAPEPGSKAKYVTFDPCIWKQGKYYYLISGTSRWDGSGGKRLPTWHLFRSKDLEHWEYRHPFVENDNVSMLGDDGACPYFLPIGNEGKYLLIHFSHKSGACYLLGDYDTRREKFIVTGGGRITRSPVGSGVIHAPSAFPDGKGGVVCIFNTTTTNLTKATQTKCMTLPVLYTLDSHGELCAQPYEGVKSLRGDHKRLEDIALPAGEEVVLDGIDGSSMELHMEFGEKTPNLEIDVLRDPSKNEYTRLVFFRRKGYADRTYLDDYHMAAGSAFMIDPWYGSEFKGYASHIPEIFDVRIGDKEPLKLDIFIDRSIVEVFVNGREYAMRRTFPVGSKSTGISIKAASATVLKVVDAWKMNGIYNY